MTSKDVDGYLVTTSRLQLTVWRKGQTGGCGCQGGQGGHRGESHAKSQEGLESSSASVKINKIIGGKIINFMS